MVFSGDNVRGTLRRCTFNSTCLHAAHGAHITAVECSWRSSHAAVLAHGTAARADISRCSVTARFGIIVEAGAAVTVRSTALRCSITAVVVNDSMSLATMEFCRIIGRQKTESRAFSGSGRWLCMYGGSALVENTIVEYGTSAAFITGCSTTMEVCGGAIACAPGITAVGKSRMGLSEVCFWDERPRAFSSSDACVGVITMMDCKAGATSRGGISQVRRCEVDTVAPTWRTPRSDQVANVLLHAGSQMALVLCELRGRVNVDVQSVKRMAAAALQSCSCNAAEVCVRVTGLNAYARVHGSQLLSGGSACVCRERAHMAAVGTTLRGGVCMLHGSNSVMYTVVSVQSGSDVCLLDCSILDGLVGVLVDQASCKVVRVRIAGLAPGAEGIEAFIQGGAQANMPKGLGCRGGVMEVRDSTVHGCVTAAWAAPAQPDDVALAGDEHARIGSCMRFTRVVFEAYGRAITVGDFSDISVSGCVFKGHVGMPPETARAMNRFIDTMFQESIDFRAAIVF